MNRTLVITAAWLVAAAAAAPASTLDDRVADLVDGLDADTADGRAAAEAELVALAGETPAEARRLLDALPAPAAPLPPAVRAGVDRVRDALERLLTDAAAEASRVTISARGAPLSGVLHRITEQTGNTLRDNREQFGEAAGDTPVTLAADNEAFWPVVDRLLDSAGLAVYAYGGAGELTLINRAPGARDRAGAAAYAGPFRFEPIRAVATRGSRDPSENALNVDLEIAWEPRLRPIALTQPLADLAAMADDGLPLTLLAPVERLDVEVGPGLQAIELRLAFELPDLSPQEITSLKGRATALTAGRVAEFRFDRVGAQPAAAEQRRGDVTVTLERFFRNNAIWELRMRLRLDRAGDALASHRGWVFQNPSYLVDAGGRRLDNVGFETTLQTESEVGLAYFFDFTEADDAGGEADPAAWSWVYETPSAVRPLPIEYELREIALP